VLSDLGGCHLHLGNTDSALHYISQAFVKAEVTRDTMQLAITGSQLAIAHRRLGNLDLAQQYCERSIFYSKLSLWNPRKNYLTMAQIYNDQGNTDSVISNCYRALNAAEEGAFLDTSSISAFELLADAYETKGIMDSAMKYLRKGIEANEMVASREKTKRIEGIDFERQLNESRIEQARKDATMKANVDRQRLIKNLGFAGIGLVLIFLIILLNRFRATRKSKLETEAEKERGDELLLNILPPEVAEELKNTGKARSVRFDEVSVLFTDFVGFTEITEDWSAEEVVWEINTCFSEFDRIAAKYGIEKIKTIGDSYMCAGGIPTPSNTHVIDTIKAALEFRAFIQQRIDKLKKDGREAFQIRIGIHTGPVVAGIVGVKKFQYDIWGSTVNTASRMESHGESGKVNISEATYSRVSGDPGFMFTKRETLEVKGKGSMQMYFVDAVEIEALL
jgi:class 3 adenylate cyclase